MGGKGKHRWKISFHRSSSSEKKQPPSEFVCPISGSIMADPVIVSSGQTFERVSVQVCKKLGFVPVLSDGSRPDFSAVIANRAINSTILTWCDSKGVEHPKVPDYASIEKIVRSSMPSKSQSDIGSSERELLKGVAEKPAVMFSHAATELAHRANHFYSSSEESVVVTASPATPLPLATRPSCYSSCSSSSEIVSDETLTPNPIHIPSEEEGFLAQLKSSEVHEQEEGLISLRNITRTKEEARVSLCTPRLLLALRALIISRYSVVQTNAVASLVNLSLEKSNKVKIVRSGILPPLIDVLKGGFVESQEHAAGALFSLALEDDNKTAIGVLGALPPLLNALRSESERARHDSALALYHLSLVQSNRIKLVKLGAVSTLLTIMRSGNMAGRVVLVLCNLAACTEGRSAMLDGNAVECLVGMLRDNELDSEATREYCVAALYSLSTGSLRFKGLAKEAKAVEVLREVEERGSERASHSFHGHFQMATRISSFLFSFTLIATLLISIITTCSGTVPENHVAFFIFGDSLFDAGNNNYLKGSSQVNHFPYGETFFHKATGRVCDGRTVPDFISEYAKLPFIKPYLEPGFVNYTNGVNFASAGAGVLSQTHPGTMHLKTQHSYFEAVVKGLKKQLGDAGAKKLLSKAVYLFSIGGNDYISLTSRPSNLKMTSSDKKKYMSMVLGNFTSVIKEVYNNGGRKFGFQNVGPLGCMPATKCMMTTTSAVDCLKEPQILAKLHNIALSKLLNKLSTQLPGFKYSLFDYYTTLAQRILSCKKFGFKEGKTACCGSGAYNGNFSCGGKNGTIAYNLCSNPSEYVWFDGGHPTEKTNKQLAELLWSGEGRVTGPYNFKMFFETL